jgi:hypothetical protein
MKIEKLMRIGSLVFMVAAAISALPGAAHAYEWCIPYWGCISFGGPSYPGPSSVTGAPEIDAGMAISGVTMLVASVLVIVERRRRRR